MARQKIVEIPQRGEKSDDFAALVYGRRHTRSLSEDVNLVTGHYHFVSRKHGLFSSVSMQLPFRVSESAPTRCMRPFSQTISA